MCQFHKKSIDVTQLNKKKPKTFLKNIKTETLASNITY